jgi:hypothetical protein
VKRVFPGQKYMPYTMLINDRLRSQLAQLSRAELFAGLFLLGCANGLAGRIGQSLTQHDGWVVAVLATFKISIIIFVACFAGVALVFRDKADEVRSCDDGVQLADLAVAAVFVALVLLPISPLSWLAVTALSLYILLFRGAGWSGHRGAIILLATTVPMLWSPLLFDFFATLVLQIDASLVGWLLGTHRSGNMVEFADHSTNLVIYPGCSSLANVSLAFLCWVTLSQSVRHKWHPQDLLWCLLTCTSVIAVNVTRISLMGLSLPYYHAIHNPLGDTITNAIIFGLTVGISVLGLRREIFSRP